MLVDPLKYQEIMEAAHEGAPVEDNFNILFRGVTVAGRPFIDLFSECMVRSGTEVGRWKLFRRASRAFNLAQYFDYSLGVDGARVECGVFQGFSALMMAEIQRLRESDFRGRDLHLVDSFEGLSEFKPSDAVATRDTGDGGGEPVYGYEKGYFATPQETVQETMHAFPEVAFHKGWIPEILDTLPERTWAFVHIDVDLYEPTLGCLEYFVPRMAPGGCIVNDDFASPMFPGGFTGWREFCERHGLGYAVLDSGQSVLICQ